VLDPAEARQLIDARASLDHRIGVGLGQGIAGERWPVARL
jgi:hypothetical protein